MSNISEQIKEELKQARETCEVTGDGSQECAEAWNAVEAKATESEPAPSKPKNSLEVYCDDNPEAAECRLYED